MHDLIVDVSNACRDSRLADGGDAEWSRLDRLLDVWSADINPHTDPILVADDNLARYMRGDNRKRWKFLYKQGKLRSVPHADTLILELAQKTGASILSRDRFIAHRRDNPWIDGDAQHFWSWSVSATEGIVIQRRPLAPVPDADMTRAEEETDLKARGLSFEALKSGGLLSNLWACRSLGCCYRDKPAVTQMPRPSGQGARCPICNSRLVDLGPRPPARRLYLVAFDGKVVDRRSLANDQVIQVGRGPQVNTWNVQPAGSVSHVGRRHAQLEVKGGQVVVTDLDSRNGTMVSQWDPKSSSWTKPRRIATPTTLRSRDRICLPNGIHIEQSAAKYVVPDIL